jgi:hypothetical protein
MRTVEPGHESPGWSGLLRSTRPSYRIAAWVGGTNLPPCTGVFSATVPALDGRAGPLVPFRAIAVTRVVVREDADSEFTRSAAWVRSMAESTFGKKALIVRMACVESALGMSTPGIKIKLVLYAPKGAGAVQRLEEIRSGLPAAEVTELRPLELEGPAAKAFDYNSKMQLKGQALAWTLYGCDGQVHSMGARQALLKGAHGILLWADSAAEVGGLESALAGDFDLVAGKTYALGIVTKDAAAAKGHLVVAPTSEPQAMMKELMKAALKVANS